ncbi:MAG: FlgO family outer membrane protein [Hydrogenophilus sp.]|nr:FlgO family outer membrane protein [Hydrogenophilus sp.]
MNLSPSLPFIAVLLLGVTACTSVKIDQRQLPPPPDSPCTGPGCPLPLQPLSSMRPATRPTPPACQASLCSLTEALNLLAEQLDANVKHRTAFPAILASTFVNLDHIDDTSPLGRVLTEGLVARLQVRGWNLYDVRLSRAVAVTPEGEFVLSRDPKRLEYQYAAAAALTGTYSVGSNEVLIHARITDVSSGVVVSSAEVRLPIDGEVARLLTDHDQLRPMRIIRGQ